MTAVQSSVFGRRREPHTVIIARGDEIRHFTVRPWIAALAGSLAIALSIGYLGATSYLVLRDNIISAATARQARVQQAYEDRISALRAQVDRITSRQLLDQQLMETRVTELIERQSRLSDRHGRLGPILDRAGREISGPLPLSAPLPSQRNSAVPEITGSIEKPEKQVRAAAVGANPFANWTTRGANPSPMPVMTAYASSAQPASQADRADELFVTINRSLKEIEDDQLAHITQLADAASLSADAISNALETAGLPVDLDLPADGMARTDVGGPLIPVDTANLFDIRLRELDEALQTLSHVKSEVRRLPLSNPAPGHAVTSTFGVRRDPLIGSAAFHSGMDFRAPVGMEARASAAGTVVKAGWNGGYGRMVEIDHGQGFSTRYAHLSRISVSEGQNVEAGDIVGRTGNTGRSTGPHLHYEVRQNGTPLNPLRFLKAGKAIEKYL
ncbi:M23 family metallopeptidase [Aquamicrobium lusatiense]|uniref:M23 family metallopeptidase n=1 Tax=Aquamicrobium lusatiense TaxID=89772 RepID=UPI003CC7D88E